MRASFVAVHFPLATLSYAVSDFHITSASIHTSLLSSPSLFFANSQLNSTGVHCVHHRTRRYLPHALDPNWTWTCPSPKRAAAAAAAAVNKKNLYMNRPQNTPIHAHYWRHRHWCPKQVNSGCAPWGGGDNKCTRINWFQSRKRRVLKHTCVFFVFNLLIGRLKWVETVGATRVAEWDEHCWRTHILKYLRTFPAHSGVEYGVIYEGYLFPLLDRGHSIVINTWSAWTFQHSIYLQKFCT